MPVLMAESNSPQLRASGYEVDKLVEEVRERLCLKSREKLYSVRRSTPYGRKGATFVDSPDHGEKAHWFSHRARDSSSRSLCSQCSSKVTKCKCSSSSDLNETPNLLRQLLAEHRLIQEAVRRIHLFQHQRSDSGSANVESPSPCSVRSTSTDSVDSSTFSSTTEL